MVGNKYSKWMKMEDLIKKDFSKASWVSLCVSTYLQSEGEYGFENYICEFFGAYSVITKTGNRYKALKTSYTDVSVNFDNRPYAAKSEYWPAGYFKSSRNGIMGNYLVLIQSFDSLENEVWHVNQDLILALGLLRNGDTWNRPSEDDIPVIRLKRNKEGKPCSVEIKAEHLRDYLCARGCGLLVSRFHSRRYIQSSPISFKWSKGDMIREENNYRWNFYIREIHEGGDPYGATTAISITRRKNIDYNEDVPKFTPADEDSTDNEFREVNSKGKKLYYAEGSLWKNEWICPAKTSPRVREDKVQSTIPFIIENDGQTAVSEEFRSGIRWLWFRPGIMKEILKRKRSLLVWFSGNTGMVGPNKNDKVHFGINQKGLINVFTEDIACLPEIYKKLWAAYNVTPEGGVSEELLKSQMECNPANTVSPEKAFVDGLDALDEIFEKKFGKPLLKHHDFEKEIQKRVHRFYGTNIEGVFELSKEITRVFIERINNVLLKKITPGLDKEIGSIKRLAELINMEGFDGKKITSPLVAVYELRKGDAHLPSNDTIKNVELAGIEYTEDFIKVCYLLIKRVSESIIQMYEIFSS